MLRPRDEQEEPLMGVTKVSEKGQVSIPFEMRERLRLTKGTRLVAFATQDVVILQRVDALLGGIPSLLKGYKYKPDVVRESASQWETWFASGDPLFDAIGTMGIGVLLIAVAVFIAIEVKAMLIGQSVDPATREAIRKFIEQRPEVKQVFHLITLQLGNDILVSVKMSQVKSCILVRCFSPSLDICVPQTSSIFSLVSPARF